MKLRIATLAAITALQASAIGLYNVSLCNGPGQPVCPNLETHRNPTAQDLLGLSGQLFADFYGTGDASDYGWTITDSNRFGVVIGQVAAPVDLIDTSFAFFHGKLYCCLGGDLVLTDINDRNEVVGRADDVGIAAYARIHLNGPENQNEPSILSGDWETFHFPNGIVLPEPVNLFGIDDSGRILAGNNDFKSSLLVSPIPEPATSLGMALCLACIWVLKSRRNRWNC